jgi:hypothetical protein
MRQILPVDPARIGPVDLFATSLELRRSAPPTGPIWISNGEVAAKFGTPSIEGSSGSASRVTKGRARCWERIRARRCEGSAKALQLSGPKRTALEPRGFSESQIPEGVERLSWSRRHGMVVREPYWPAARLRCNLANISLTSGSLRRASTN